MQDEAILSNRPTLLDRVEAGVLSMEQFEEAVVSGVYAGLHQYFQIPDGYVHCGLDTRAIDLESLSDKDLRAMLRTPPTEIINPQQAHIKAIELFSLLLEGDPLVCDRGDPLMPTIGAYLYGPPGTGKTHLMAAYGRHVRTLLDHQLSHMASSFHDVFESAFQRYLKRQISESRDGRSEAQTGFVEISADRQDLIQGNTATEEFWASIEDFKQRLKTYAYQPTDLIYIGFKELVELTLHSPERKTALDALEQARIVFIDDVHPQGDLEQIQIVLHLLERRYELGRAGTFLTSNLEANELGGGDAMLGSRLLSRCAETLVTVDFSGCDDWRQTVKARRVRIVEDELIRRISSHRHIVDDD